MPMRTKPSTVKPWTPGSKRQQSAHLDIGRLHRSLRATSRCRHRHRMADRTDTRRARQHQPGHQATDRSSARDDPGPLRRHGSADPSRCSGSGSSLHMATDQWRVPDTESTWLQNQGGLPTDFKFEPTVCRCRSNPCGANRKWPWFTMPRRTTSGIQTLHTRSPCSARIMG